MTHSQTLTQIPEEDAKYLHQLIRDDTMLKVRYIVNCGHHRLPIQPRTFVQAILERLYHERNYSFKERYCQTTYRL